MEKGPTRLEKNRIYMLPVKRRRTENRRTYYVVEAEGREYAIRLFEFQKDEPVPESLPCKVKDIHEGVPTLVQDFGPLLQRFYREGETYPFEVLTDCTDMQPPYYEVADSNGFRFRLMYYGDTLLTPRQRVRCRVRSLRGHRLSLELVRDEDGKEEETCWLPDDLLQATDAPDSFARWANDLFRRSPDFAEARETFAHNRIGGIVLALETMSRTMPMWAKPQSRRNIELLDRYTRVCLHLLEESSALEGCPPGERDAFRATLENALRNAEIHAQALRLLDEGRQEEFADTLLAKVRKAGYVYRAEEKFAVLSCLFVLDDGLMRQKMGEVFAVLQSGRLQHWQEPPFRTAFLALLERYIENHRSTLDHIAVVGTPAAQAAVGRMVSALAMTQLLATADDTCDHQLNRIMLYRYLALMQGGNPHVLLEKAFRCLADVQVGTLEFGWNDVCDPKLLALKLSCGGRKPQVDETSMTLTYERKDVQLRIMNNNVQLLPTRELKKARKALPDWLLPWHHLQVLLDKGKVPSPGQNERDLSLYQQMWKDTEYALFHNPDPAPQLRKPHKVQPEQGDMVMIRVLERDPLRPDYFRCRIEDDTYQGEGWLCIRNVVRYNLHIGMDAFCSDAGKPYLLQAEVHGVNDQGECAFGLLGPLARFVRQNVGVGDAVTCLVTDCKNGLNLCISDYAYPVTLTLPESTVEAPAVGDFIEVKVADVNPRGTVTAVYVGTSRRRFTVEEVFADLIASYAGDHVYEEEEEKESGEQNAEVMLEESYVTELMYIIDQVALLQEDRVKTYNYLALARVIALLTGKEEMADYYTQRMRFIRLLQQFVINGRVDMEQLDAQGRIARETLSRYPLLQNRLTELRIVNCLGRPEKNAFLWTVADEGDGHKRLTELARLTLAGNLLEGFGMDGLLQDIRAKVCELINLDVDEQPAYTFGEENQQVEFKTSLVYPPENRMRPDLMRQTQAIMCVICGFLNAEGGTLYLGVNNKGVAEGLAADIAYFQGDRDKYDLHIRNKIVYSMGLEANSCVSVFHPEAGGKWIYALNIKPCPHPVKCNGIYYQRQGTSTWPLQGDALDAFLQNRATPPSKPPVVPEPAPPAPETAVPETPVPAPEPAPKPKPEPAPPAPETVALSAITTSQLRHNVVHSYEEGFGENTVSFLHLLENNGYMLTRDEVWRPDVLLSLAIHEDEEKGCLVIVYESGRALRVPMAELLERTEGREYKRFGLEKVVFACPAGKDDGLLLVQSDMQQRPAFRLDEVSSLKESNMLSKGEHLTSIPATGVLQCDIIPCADKQRFKRILNLKATNIGPNLTTDWGAPEQEEFRQMGIRILCNG